MTTTIHPAAGWSGATSTPAQVGSDPRKAIARWKSTQYQIATGTLNLDLLAYHPLGIDKVQFGVNGGTFADVSTAEAESYESSYTSILDPSGQPMGYTRLRFRVAIDAADFADPATAEIRAKIIPIAGFPVVLQGDIADDTTYPGMIVYCRKNGFTPEVQTASSATTVESLAQSIAEGGIIKLRPGTYAMPNSSNTVRANTLRVTIQPDDGVDRTAVVVTSGDLASGYIDLKVKRLTWQDLSFDLSGFNAIKNGSGYRQDFAGCYWYSSLGWGKNTAGVNKKGQPFSNDFSADPSQTWFVGSANHRGYCYNSLYGATANYVYDSDFYQISGSPFLSPLSIHNITLGRFNTDYVATADPAPGGDTYHRDVWHCYVDQDNGFLADVILNSDAGGPDRVEAQVFNFEAPRNGLGGSDHNGTISNFACVNIIAPTAPVVNADENNFGGPQYSESSGWLLNVTWANVYIPSQAFVFNPANVTPTDCSIQTSALHWSNYLNWILNTTPPGGVTLTSIAIGGISSRAVQGFAAVSGVSGVGLSWGINAWPDADNLTLYKANGTGSFASLAGPSLATTTYSDTAVSDGVAYRYLMKSYDVSSGAEVLSALVPITYSVGDARPDQPANVTATPASGQITLAWDPQIADGFRVYAGNGTTVLYDGTDTSFAVTGLTDGVTNTFYVAAYNANGESTRKRVVATAGGDAPIRTGLTALLDANAGSGSTIADSVGSNNLTVVNGATWAGAPTYTRTGLLSDAADEGARIAAPDIALKPTGDFTFFWWGRFLGNPTVSSHISGIVYDTSSNPPYTPYSFLHNSGAGVVPAAGYNTGGGFALHNMPGTFSAGTDYVLCMRVEGGVITLGASNGSALTDTPDTWASAYAASSNFAVAVYNALSRNANLITYLTSVSNRALSDDEIADVLADPTLLENPPTLNAPSVTVDIHDETSITVSWTPGSGGTGNNTFDAYIRVSGVGSYTLVEAGVTSPYQYTGLDSGTAYDLQITQSDDDPVTPQSASASVTQTTDAAAATSTTPPSPVGRSANVVGRFFRRHFR